MHRVRLIHWNAAEANERAAQLRAAKYEVVHLLPNGADLRLELKEAPPSAVVIDLSRLPMQGRDVGVALRHYKTTRFIPLIFVAGDPEKIARVQQSLPDAIYTTWDQIRTALKDAIANPPAVTVVPQSVLAGYSGTPLAKKLGIVSNAIVGLVNPPPGIEEILGDLPDGVKLRRQVSSRRNLTIWFTRSRKDLESEIERMALLAEQGPLWIAWPKKASPLKSDLTQAVVRKVGLAAGLVDYKICAIDAVWSGLLFTRRLV
jgi:CheY-like chemotaxis protein